MLKKLSFFNKICFFYGKNSKKNSGSLSKNPSLLSLVRENVKSSLKTQKFGLEVSKTMENAPSQKKKEKKPFFQKENEAKKLKKKEKKFEYEEEEMKTFIDEEGEGNMKEEGGIKEEGKKILEEEKISVLKVNENETLRKKTIVGNEFSLDFVNLPWNYSPTNIFPKEENIIAPLDISTFLYETTVISLIKNFLLSLENMDYEELSDILEPSFYKKVENNLKKLQDNGYSLKLKKFKKNSLNVNIFKVKTVLTVGTNENRLANEGERYYDMKETIYNNTPCLLIVRKNLDGESEASMLLQISCAFNTEGQFSILDMNGNTVKSHSKEEKGVHFMVIETVIMREKYEELAKKSLAFERKYFSLKEGEGKHLNKLKFWIIDFDDFMSGNPLIH